MAIPLFLKVDDFVRVNSSPNGSSKFVGHTGRVDRVVIHAVTGKPWVFVSIYDHDTCDFWSLPFDDWRSQLTQLEADYGKLAKLLAYKEAKEQLVCDGSLLRRKIALLEKRDGKL